MAVTIVSFRWLEILEKEFDKNFVDLDLLIGDLDAEEPDFVYSARQKLAGLSSCFAQLTHKAQTIFQNSAKVEAELLDLRTELVSSKTRQEVLEEESRNLVLQLHSLQLDRLPSNQNPEQYKEKIETALKLSPSKSAYSEEITFRNSSEIKKLKNELLQYQSENIILRNSILALHSEVYGARLAAKYLDKELAGRIQQLQLLGKEMRTDIRDKLWRQLESEILLHRHKTVIRACRNRTNHEFIQPDSRILNFNHSDGRYFNHEFNNRHTQLRFEGAGNRYNFIMNKEPLHKFQMSDVLNRNIINSNSEFPKEKNTDQNELKDLKNNDVKENTENKNNVESKEDFTNESSRNNCSKEENKDLKFKSNSGSPSKEGNKNEEKTDEEKPDEPFKIALKNEKRNGLVDGEEVLCMVGEKRNVVVKRQPGQGLGISITGGREHGVPILISELEIGGPAYECKNLFVGDAILKVNDVSLENASHFEAVKILTSLETNNVKLLVQFIAVDTDEENSLSEDLYGYRYRFFDTEVMDSSDALGLHPLHSNSAHTPTAPRTPDYGRSQKIQNTSNCVELEKQAFDGYNSSHSVEVFTPKKQSSELLFEKKCQNLIDIDTELSKDETEQLKIDLFGYRFQTDIRGVSINKHANLLDDFLVKRAENAKLEADLIQIEVADSKPEKKFEYVDENIFSGLEDHSLLDNIMKSFSEDDFSYLDTEKEKNMTSDSGLEVCLSGSDVDVEKICLEEPYKDKNYLNDWIDNANEKVEVKTLQQIFDRSFSSNLSSPRGSTSFDDDILSTEHSDEKSHSIGNFKSKNRDMTNNISSKKMQKFCAKSFEHDEILKKLSQKNEGIFNLKNEIINGKKMKRSASDSAKRSKSGRKVKENTRKDIKIEKRKNLKETETDVQKCANDLQKKRELNYKITERFDENLIEYNVKSYEINQLSPVKVENRLQSFEFQKQAIKSDPSDEMEETRKLSRKYGLKIPGKGVKSEPNNSILVTEVKSPERCIKVLESHFKHFKPVLENSLKPNEKDNPKTKTYRCNRYDSFGDPDFGTPV